MIIFEQCGKRFRIPLLDWHAVLSTRLIYMTLHVRMGPMLVSVYDEYVKDKRGDEDELMQALELKRARQDDYCSRLT